MNRMLRGALSGLAEGVADYTDQLISQRLAEIRQQRLLQAQAAFEDARYPLLRERAMQEQRDAWALEDERYPTLLQRKINERKALGIGQGRGGGGGDEGASWSLKKEGWALKEIDGETVWVNSLTGQEMSRDDMSNYSAQRLAAAGAPSALAAATGGPGGGLKTLTPSQLERLVAKNSRLSNEQISAEARASGYLVSPTDVANLRPPPASKETRGGAKEKEEEAQAPVPKSALLREEENKEEEKRPFTSYWGR